MGMDEVETAAADTTSEHSSSPTPLHHAHTYQLGHITPPNYPSKMTGTPLSLSSDHHSQQPTWEARNTQLGREREFDDEFEFEGGAPPFKRQRMETIGDQSSQMSPETSVHVRRHHGDRPVGIAQPMQLQDTQQTSSPSLPIPSASKESPLSLLTSKEDIDQLQKQKVPSYSSSPLQLKHSSSSSSSPISPFHSSAQVQVQVHSPEQPVATTIPTQQSQSTSGTFGDGSGSTGGSGTKVDLVVPQDCRKIPINYLDEVYDSDQSQESQRFDKFINESSNKSSGSSSTERLTLSDNKQHFESLQESTASSETSSESTTRFIATYVTPNLKYLDSDACIESSTNQSDVKSILDSPSHQHDLPPPPPPPVETPPGMCVSKEPFDPHVPPPWIGSGSDEEERHGHLPAYGGVEKDYSAAPSRRRSSSHLPTTRPIESE